MTHNKVLTTEFTHGSYQSIDQYLGVIDVPSRSWSTPAYRNNQIDDLHFVCFEKSECVAVYHQAQLAGCVIEQRRWILYREEVKR